ncbi:shikimate kinase [Sporolactobacillus kofuensis]|uniref:Shikimate kinase n=1 Tax=Sporolactobacillus kofuensis TaxID=269672 RepID=A0ABW1WJ21_9BACL|nr:shikimate kinase [Sporolactobacillus kofuensis]MCO7176516.1 shikimate kinase [Sporolactobacillus kofuensis]
MIFITGFMGAGKTTLGRALEEKINAQVFDTDQLIEQKQQTTISKLFEEKGEPFFRACETELLQELLPMDRRTIVTTGGGMICNPMNRQLMHEKGTIVFLYCDIKMIHQRLLNDQTRPLAQKNQGTELDLLYQKRLPDYLDADHVINTTGKSVDAIVDEYLAKMYQNAPQWANCL